jgi:uncharacterized protein YijF (DUF1287 family)
MARARSGFYNTIEYIGPRPQKPKRKNFFGGWVIIVIALGMGFWFGQPLVQLVKGASAGGSMEQADVLISSLKKSPEFGDGLAAAALANSTIPVTFDQAYYKIGYPNGDVRPNIGMAADVIIRSFRGMDMDLQKLVHEDMVENFREYPQLWDAAGPDSNIDHRRVENLQRYFTRKGEVVAPPRKDEAGTPSRKGEASPSRNASEYKPGDIVVWALANAEMHIGIVVPGPGDHANEPWVVHNMGAGVKWENVLFDYSIQSHFRFPAQTEK